MAQWTGQFTGRTHDTKVQDIELSLRHAITSLEAAPEMDRVGKLNAVRKLSKGLLDARLKVLRARISALSEPGSKRMDTSMASQLSARVRELEALGVDEILREFGVNEKPLA